MQNPDLTDNQMEIAVICSLVFSRRRVWQHRGDNRGQYPANARRPYHWIGLAWANGVAVGVITVTTMLYIELGAPG